MRAGILYSFRRQLRELAARRLQVPEIPIALNRLRAIGFSPANVVDVGAYRGEFAHACAQLWPSCKIFCFEAQRSPIVHLRQLSIREPRIVVVEALVGAAESARVTLNASESASSMLEEHAPSGFPIEHHRLTTLDAAEELSRVIAIDLLKIDVQGYELEVLRGAEMRLRSVSAILVELNLLDIHRDVPLMPEIVAWLNQRGFVPYDICGLTRRPLDAALWQADVIFVPVGSSLRADKRWRAD